MQETAMPFDAAAVRSLADALIAARARGAATVPAPAELPASIEDAYRVQDAVIARLGPAAGWKVGASSRTATPVCAPILREGVRWASDGPAPGAATTGVELEIAFLLGRDFPAARTAPSAAEVEAAIAGAYIALETCASRLAEGPLAPPALAVADNAMNLGLIVGPGLADWRRINADRLVARVDADGMLIAETTGGHTHKDLLALLVWQVGHCVTRRGGTAAGCVITTGSWMGIRWVPTPATVTGEFVGLGAIEARITA
jgi:2-keto-4-pentenoate hydratase